MGVTKYCTATPMTFDTIQYIDKPLGNWREKKAIIIGIIQSIIVWFDCCFGSVDGLTVNFCCTQVDTNTNAGIITRVGSGSARSNMPRKLALTFNGAAFSEKITGDVKTKTKQSNRRDIVSPIR